MLGQRLHINPASGQCIVYVVGAEPSTPVTTQHADPSVE